VLISPISFRHADLPTQLFHLALTTDKIMNSPTVAADQQVSRQREREYNRYYGYRNYWDGGQLGVWGAGCDPAMLESWGRSDAPPERPVPDSRDAHLRSANDVRGYGIDGSDGAIGFVADFLVDDETWEVRYLVVDTSHWWRSKTVLVAPSWSTQISWDERKLFVNLSRDTIKNGPSWDGASTPHREYEVRLHDYHRRPGYWIGWDASAGGSPPPHRFRSRSA
jgi:hypothetical protein